MLGIHDWWLFIISGVLLNLMPGPDTLFIMSKSASQGWKAGVVASLGICSGVYVHVFAAAFGLSALFVYKVVFFSKSTFSGFLFSEPYKLIIL